MIDAGAEDIFWDESNVTISSDVSSWTKVRDALKAAGFVIGDAGMKYVPTQKANVAADKVQQLMDFVEAIEEDEDVSEVHTNADVVD